MSKNEQTPSTSNRSLLIILAIIVIGVAWLIWQAGKEDTPAPAKNTNQNTPNKDDEKQTDEYAGWKSYTWESQGVTFKHPGDWTVKTDDKMDRLYVRNSEVDLLKEETPANFQQVWFSADMGEASQAREDAIKKGESAYREIAGPPGNVQASTVKAGNLTINVYEYATTGGATLEAYWTNKAGARLYATNSTEVGEKNQTDMVANLKKILASITLQ